MPAPNDTQSADILPAKPGNILCPIDDDPWGTPVRSCPAFQWHLRKPVQPVRQPNALTAFFGETIEIKAMDKMTIFAGQLMSVSQCTQAESAKKANPFQKTDTGKSGNSLTMLLYSETCKAMTCP